MTQRDDLNHLNTYPINSGGSPHNKKIKKYVVFDVDETLGYFSQFGTFVDALNNYYSDFSRIVFDNFNELLDLYPEFIRPNMIEILKYVTSKKRDDACNGIIIYTNNQGPRMWVANISKYFEYKVGSRVFDQIIAAFKIRGEIVQQGRTTQNKTFDDLVRVANISPTSEICFVDDLNHPDMRHPNVLYINVKPYVKTLSAHTMIKRYLDSPLGKNILPHNIDKFIKSIKKRIGVDDDVDKTIDLNLHESNFISLYTPDTSHADADADYKKTGDKLLLYIKSFFKNKKTPHNRRRMTATIQRQRMKTKSKATKKYTTHQQFKIVTNRNNTRKIGKFMRI